MPALDDICSHYAFENHGQVERFLEHHPHIAEHLAALVPIIKEHMPEAGTPRIKHTPDWPPDGDLMIYIPLPATVSTDDGRRFLKLVDEVWWGPLPVTVRAVLLADVQWSRGNG